MGWWWVGWGGVGGAVMDGVGMEWWGGWHVVVVSRW